MCLTTQYQICLHSSAKHASWYAPPYSEQDYPAHPYHNHSQQNDVPSRGLSSDRYRTVALPSDSSAPAVLLHTQYLVVRIQFHHTSTLQFLYRRLLMAHDTRCTFGTSEIHKLTGTRKTAGYLLQQRVNHHRCGSYPWHTTSRIRHPDEFRSSPCHHQLW